WRCSCNARRCGRFSERRAAEERRAGQRTNFDPGRKGGNVQRRRIGALALFATLVALAVAGFSAAGGGASLTAAAKNPWGATLPDGKYGESYNPKKSIVDYALGGAAALPTDAMQRNIALAAFTRAGKKVNEKLALQRWKKNICETGTGGKITDGEPDGFGGNVARQLYKIELT